MHFYGLLASKISLVFGSWVKHSLSKSRVLADKASNPQKVFVTGAGGFIGGAIAVELARRGHHVVGLIRRAEQAADLEKLGIKPIVGSLDDKELLIAQAKAADAVVNAASADHHGAVEAFLEALDGTGKTFVHTSGSSIVGDASGTIWHCRRPLKGGTKEAL